MRDLVTTLALLAGTVCFALYVYETIVSIRLRAAAPEVARSADMRALAADPTIISVAQITDLLGAMAKLTDSLAKAGPALTSILGAILFFVVAALSSGALN